MALNQANGTAFLCSATFDGGVFAKSLIPPLEDG